MAHSIVALTGGGKGWKWWSVGYWAQLERGALETVSYPVLFRHSHFSWLPVHQEAKGLFRHTLLTPWRSVQVRETTLAWPLWTMDKNKSFPPYYSAVSFGHSNAKVTNTGTTLEKFITADICPGWAPDLTISMFGNPIHDLKLRQRVAKRLIYGTIPGLREE